MANKSVLGKIVVDTALTDKEKPPDDAPIPPGPDDYKSYMIRLEIGQKQNKQPVNRGHLPTIVKKAMSRMFQEDKYMRIIPKNDWPTKFIKEQYDGKRRLQIDANKVPQEPADFDGYFEYTNNEYHPYESEKIVVRCYLKTILSFSELKNDQLRSFLSARNFWLYPSCFRTLQEATCGWFSELHPKFTNFEDLKEEIRTLLNLKEEPADSSNADKSMHTQTDNEATDDATSKQGANDQENDDEDDNEDDEATFTTLSDTDGDTYVPAMQVVQRRVYTGIGKNLISTNAVVIRCEARHRDTLHELLQSIDFNAGTYWPYSVTKHDNAKKAMLCQTRFLQNTRMLKLLGTSIEGLAKEFTYSGTTTSMVRELLANGIHGIHRPSDKQTEGVYIIYDTVREDEIVNYIDSLIAQVSRLPQNIQDTITLPNDLLRRMVPKSNRQKRDNEYDSRSCKTNYWNSDLSTVPSKPNAWRKPPAIILRKSDQRSSSPVSTLADSQRTSVTVEEVNNIVNAKAKELKQQHEKNIAELKSEMETRFADQDKKQKAKDKQQSDMHDTINKMWEWMQSQQKATPTTPTRRSRRLASQDDPDDSDYIDVDVDAAEDAIADEEFNRRNFDSEQIQVRLHAETSDMNVSKSREEEIIFSHSSPNKSDISSIRSEYDETAIVPHNTQRQISPQRQTNNSMGSSDSRHYLEQTADPGAIKCQVRFYPQVEVEKYQRYRMDNSLPVVPSELAHQPPYMDNRPTQWIHSAYGPNHPKFPMNNGPMPYFPPEQVLRAEHQFYHDQPPPPADYIPPPAISPYAHQPPPPPYTGPLPAQSQQQHLPASPHPQQPPATTVAQQHVPTDQSNNENNSQTPTQQQQQLSANQAPSSQDPTALKQGDGGSRP